MNLANEISETRKSITNDIQALSEQVGEIKNETSEAAYTTHWVFLLPKKSNYSWGSLFYVEK